MAFKIKLENGKTLRFDSKPSDEEIELAVQDVMGTQAEPEPVKPSISDRIGRMFAPIRQTAESFFPAFARGATLQKQPFLSGSVTTPSLERTASRAGDIAGQAVPLAASQFLFGGPVARTALRFGTTKMAAEAVGGATAMGLFEGGRGVSERGLPKTGEEAGLLAKDVARGAVTGTVFGSGESLLSSLANFIGNKIPASIYNKLIPISKGKALKKVKAGEYELMGDDLANTPGLVGSKEELVAKGVERIDRLESQIDGAVESFSEEEVKAKFSAISIDKALEPVIALRDKLKGLPKSQAKVKQLDKFIKDAQTKYGRNVMADKAQQLKKDIWSEIKEANFSKSLTEDPLEARANILFGSGLRNELGGAIPEITPLLAQESMYVGMVDSLQKSIAGSRGTFSELFLTPFLEKSATGAARGLRVMFGTKSPARKVSGTVAKPLFRSLGLEGARNVAP